MFVNFEVGALEKWIKLAGTEGPHVNHHVVFRPCAPAIAARLPAPTVSHHRRTPGLVPPTVSTMSLSTTMGIEVNRLSSSRSPILASACQATTTQCRIQSTVLHFHPPFIHAATATCAALLLLSTLRPVSFSPPRCAILFPSPYCHCIVRSSPAALLLLVRDIKDRRAGHQSSRTCVSGLTSPSSALASSCQPPSRPCKKLSKQSRHRPPQP
jgi:hypothetical protein